MDARPASSMLKKAFQLPPRARAPLFTSFMPFGNDGNDAGDDEDDDDDDDRDAAWRASSSVTHSSSSSSVMPRKGCPPCCGETTEAAELDGGIGGGGGSGSGGGSGDGDGGAAAADDDELDVKNLISLDDVRDAGEDGFMSALRVATIGTVSFDLTTAVDFTASQRDSRLRARHSRHTSKSQALQPLSFVP